LALTLLVSLFKAFVLARLWAYFIVPLGVPGIGQAQAYGLTLIANLFLPRPSKPPEGWAAIVTLVVSDGVLGPLAVWGIGYVCYCLMHG
jgi:hypothetical protein